MRPILVCVLSISWSLFGIEKVCAPSAPPSSPAVAAPESRSYPRLNFSWRVPDEDYEFKLPSELNSSAASLALRRDPNVTISVYAQELMSIPDDWPVVMEDVILQTLAQNAARDVVMVEQKLVDHRGSPWLHMAIRAEIRGVRLHTEYWIHQRNGFLFQIIGSGDEEVGGVTSVDTRRAMEHFEMLDPSRMSSKLPGGKGRNPEIQALTRQLPEEGIEWRLPGKDWMFVEPRGQADDAPDAGDVVPLITAHCRKPVMGIEILRARLEKPGEVSIERVERFVSEMVWKRETNVEVRRRRTLERDGRSWFQVRLTGQDEVGATYHVFWVTVHREQLLVMHVHSGHASRGKVDSVSQRMFIRLRFLDGAGGSSGGS